MRLLHVRSFEFAEFHDDSQRPKYAIASHRWDVDEARFRDVEQGRNKDSAGFKKVEAFAKFVNDNVDDVEWLWIDTCCINKDSDAELSYSINSMFKWYRNADLCIAYLTTQDVGSIEQDEWFSRGWTLQELLAPRLVVFVTRDWQVIGNKGSSAYEYDATLTGPDLTTIIAKTTSIPEAVLRDWNNSPDVQVEEKIAWIEGRRTTREEDMSYALFGIVGITLNVVYGEGLANARNRLMSELRRRNEEESANVMESRRREELEKKNAEEWQEITSWLDPPNPWTNHESARKLHEQQTGNWLLGSGKYLAWKSGRHGQCLWLHGLAGSGKTVLCSTAINDMRRYCKEKPGDLGLAIFYFSFTDRRKQTYEDLLLSLVAQLASKGPGFTTLEKAFNTKDRKLPGHEDLEQILCMTLASYDTVFCILDALDESPESGGVRRRLLERLRKLVNDAPDFRILITSRDESDIRRSTTQLKCTSISVASELVTPDILRYIENEISRVPKLSRLDAATKDFVKAILSDRADGMFRYVACQLQELAKTKSTRPNSVQKALLALPATLDGTYERILRRIDPDDQPYALTLLRWLAYSYEPLTLQQLAEASVIDPADDDSDGVVEIENKGNWADTLELLAGLVVPITNDKPASLESNDESDSDDEGNPTDVGEKGGSACVANDYTTALPIDQYINERTKVRLAHFSVKEYLESSRILASDVEEYALNPGREHRFLTHSCLSYLTYYSESSFKSSPEEDLEFFPLLKYTAERWWHHAREQDYPNALREVRFLMNKRYKCDSLRFFNPRTVYRWHKYRLSAVPENEPVLPYASYYNLQDVVKGLIAAGEDINAQNEKLGGALYAAVEARHEKMCRLLLDMGADVTLRGGEHGSALELAAYLGLEALVVILLDAEAVIERRHNDAVRETSTCGSNERTRKARPPKFGVGSDKDRALCLAVQGGHETVVEILIERGADVNTRTRLGTSVLGEALLRKSSRVMKILLNGGADVNATMRHQETLLAVASRRGLEEGVRILLDARADSSISNVIGETALDMASANGHAKVVQMLLDAEADSQEIDKLLVTALADGHEQVAQTLWTVASGMPREETYSKALIAVIRRKSDTRVVTSLLESKADPLFVDEHGESAIVMTLRDDRPATGLMLDLVVAVADLAQKECYRDALSKAAGHHLEDTTWALLAEITRIFSRKSSYREGRLLWSRFAYSDIVHNLLRVRPSDRLEFASPATLEDVYRDAINKAAEYGHIEVVQILLEANAGVAPDVPPRSALIEALARGHGEIVRLLSNNISDGIDVGIYQEALINASYAGRREIVESLLAKSAGVSQQECIRLALIAAATAERSRGIEIIKILLNAGGDVNDPAGRYRDSSGSEPDEPRKFGHSLPLHAAAACGNSDVVKFLLNAGVDVHARDLNGDTALQVIPYIWEEGNEIRRMLLAAGARQDF